MEDNILEAVDSITPQPELSSEVEILRAIHLLEVGGGYLLSSENVGEYKRVRISYVVSGELIYMNLVLNQEDYNRIVEVYDSHITGDPLPEVSEESARLLEDALNPTPPKEEPKIPLNSGSLLVEETSSRFSGAIWYDAIRNRSVTLVGAGGIGSYVAFLLSRLKISYLNIYDPDIVERVNLSGQFYGVQNVGHYKTEALVKALKNYSDFTSISSFPIRFDENGIASRIMICGLDNMEARQLCFDKWLKNLEGLNTESRKEYLFIDGRLAAEEFQVFAIQGDNERAIEKYKERWLFKDSEAEETLCSYKQTTFMANMIASVMVNTFVNFVANECNPIIERDVPFMTSYTADTMYFKVEML